MQPAQTITSGIGLRAPHMQALLAERASVGFLEAHSENYFGGGKQRKFLYTLAENYPITLHGVGLSLGRADGLDQAHLKNIATLAQDINPLFVSEHLTWSAYSHMHVPDLLPLPFTLEAMDIFADHIDAFQNAVGRKILVENPSNYIAFADMDYAETDFLNELADKTGCGLLLDINNIAVSAHNLGYHPLHYITNIKSQHVKQFHLAGYVETTLPSGDTVYLDTHSEPVYDGVWELYTQALQHHGDIPTLIEWDADIPSLDVLIAEAHKADAIRLQVKGTHNVDKVA